MILLQCTLKDSGKEVIINAENILHLQASQYGGTYIVFAKDESIAVTNSVHNILTQIPRSDR